MNKFDEYVESVRNEVVEARYKAFRSPSMLPHAEIFSEIIGYNSQTIGKLLRPVMCVAVSDALGGEHSEAIHLGASIELVHAGSLVHDDIIDEDLFRRGMQTIHEKFSVKAAILYGDIMFVASAASVRTLPEHHMTKAFKELMDVYGRASSGAMREGNRDPWNLSEYFEVIRLKTAALFRASARLGCVVAEATDDTTKIISDWAESVGTAFQIADDIVDIQNSINSSTPIGDVKEGKTTLPVIYLKNKYPDFHKQFSLYASGVNNMNEIPDIIRLIPEGIMYSREYATNMLIESVNTLKLIPFKNGYKPIMDQYGEYAVRSMLKEGA